MTQLCFYIGCGVSVATFMCIHACVTQRDASVCIAAAPYIYTVLDQQFHIRSVHSVLFHCRFRTTASENYFSGFVIAKIIEV